MKRFLSCIKGESSSNARQDPQDTQVYDDEPFGDNEFLNHLWRNNLGLPDDRGVEGSIFVSLSQSFEIETSCFYGFLYLKQIWLLLRFDLVTIMQVKAVLVLLVSKQVRLTLIH